MRFQCYICRFSFLFGDLDQFMRYWNYVIFENSIGLSCEMIWAWGFSSGAVLDFFLWNYCLCFLSPIRSILVTGVSLRIYLLYHMYWLPRIFITKCYRPEGLKAMEMHCLTVWRPGVWNKMSAGPRSLRNPQGILPCVFLASGVAGDLCYSLACGYVTPVSASFHMASSLHVCMPQTSLFSPKHQWD